MIHLFGEKNNSQIDLTLQFITSTEDTRTTI